MTSHQFRTTSQCDMLKNVAVKVDNGVVIAGKVVEQSMSGDGVKYRVVFRGEGDQIKFQSWTTTQFVSGIVAFVELKLAPIFVLIKE